MRRPSSRLSRGQACREEEARRVMPSPWTSSTQVALSDCMATLVEHAETLPQAKWPGWWRYGMSLFAESRASTVSRRVRRDARRRSLRTPNWWTRTCHHEIYGCCLMYYVTEVRPLPAGMGQHGRSTDHLKLAWLPGCFPQLGDTEAGHCDGCASSAPLTSEISRSRRS